MLVWWQRGRIRPREIIALVPFFILGMVGGASTIWLEQHHVGAQGAEWDYGFTERLLLSGRIVWFYVGKLLWPLELSFNYPRWSIDASLGWHYLYPIALVGSIGMLWHQQRNLGVMLKERGELKAALTHFDNILVRYPDNVEAWNNSAAVYAAKQQPEKARKLYEKAIAINPHHTTPHFNLAYLHLTAGRYAKALHHCQEVIRLDDHEPAHRSRSLFKKILALDPTDIHTRLNLGIVMGMLFGHAGRHGLKHGSQSHQ